MYYLRITAKIKVMTGIVVVEAAANVAEVSFMATTYRFEDIVNLKMSLHIKNKKVRQNIILACKDSDLLCYKKIAFSINKITTA